MASITLEVKVHQVVDTITIELPYYCKRGRSTYAIMSESDVIEVNIYPTINCAHIYKKSDLPHDLDNFETTAITREEFQEKLDEALKLINSIL